MGGLFGALERDEITTTAVHAVNLVLYQKKLPRETRDRNTMALAHAQNNEGLSC